MGCGAEQGMTRREWVLGGTDVCGAQGLLLASPLRYGEEQLSSDLPPGFTVG